MNTTLLFRLLPVLLALGSLTAAAAEPDNRLTIPMTEWKRDFRPGNRADIYRIATESGITRISRTPASKFGRIYTDLAVEPGAVYQVSCRRMTERGALVKMLVIFRGPDGAWREKTRLSNLEPLVNGEWSEAALTFEVPRDVKEARVDFRLDSYGEVAVRDMALRKLPQGEADAWRESVKPRAFAPGNGTDYALKPDTYYRVELDARPARGQQEGSLSITFHAPEKEFVKDGSITFYCREGKTAAFREIIVTAADVDGIRTTVRDLDVTQLRFVPLQL